MPWTSKAKKIYWTNIFVLKIIRLLKSICLLMLYISAILSLESSSKISLYFKSFSLSSDLLSLIGLKSLKNQLVFVLDLQIFLFVFQKLYQEEKNKM